jgi:hypothetical protein
MIGIFCDTAKQLLASHMKCWLQHSRLGLPYFYTLFYFDGFSES